MLGAADKTHKTMDRKNVEGREDSRNPDQHGTQRPGGRTPGAEADPNRPHAEGAGSGPEGSSRIVGSSATGEDRYTGNQAQHTPGGAHGGRPEQGDRGSRPEGTGQQTGSSATAQNRDQAGRGMGGTRDGGIGTDRREGEGRDVSGRSGTDKGRQGGTDKGRM